MVKLKSHAFLFYEICMPELLQTKEFFKMPEELVVTKGVKCGKLITSIDGKGLI